MTTEGKNETGSVDPEDDEALWKLLGRQVPPAKASPYFARRVLREIALAEEQGGGWPQRIRQFWALTPRHTAAWSGAVALGVLCLSAVLVIPARHPTAARPAAPVYAADASAPANVALSPAPENAPPEKVAPVQDAELIADLDTLLNREESRLWTEDADTARF